MILIVLGLISLAGVLIYGWIKFVYWVLPKKKKQEAPHPQPNPYIEAQRRRDQNDRWYDEYISWMDHNGGGMPINKVKTPEEMEFEKKYKQAQR